MSYKCDGCGKPIEQSAGELICTKFQGEAGSDDGEPISIDDRGVEYVITIDSGDKAMHFHRQCVLEALYEAIAGELPELDIPQIRNLADEKA